MWLYVIYGYTTCLSHLICFSENAFWLIDGFQACGHIYKIELKRAYTWRKIKSSSARKWAGGTNTYELPSYHTFIAQSYSCAASSWVGLIHYITTLCKTYKNIYTENTSCSLMLTLTQSIKHIFIHWFKFLAMWTMLVLSHFTMFLKIIVYFNYKDLLFFSCKYK